MKNKERRSLKLSAGLLGGVILGVLMNCVGKLITENYVIPFRFDTVGTCLAAACFGPFWGATTGMLSNLVFYFGNGTPVGYLIVNMVVGVIVGLLYPRNKSDYFQIMYTAMLAAIGAVIIATPINMYYHNGYTGNVWGDAMFDMLEQNGKSIMFHSIVAGGFVDLPDKIISLMIATLLIKIKRYFGSRKKEGIEDEE